MEHGVRRERLSGARGQRKRSRQGGDSSKGPGKPESTRLPSRKPTVPRGPVGPMMLHCPSRSASRFRRGVSAVFSVGSFASYYLTPTALPQSASHPTQARTQLGPPPASSGRLRAAVPTDTRHCRGRRVFAPTPGVFAVPCQHPLPEHGAPREPAPPAGPSGDWDRAAAHRQRTGSLKAGRPPGWGTPHLARPARARRPSPSCGSRHDSLHISCAGEVRLAGGCALTPTGSPGPARW